MGWREVLAAIFQRRHEEWKAGESEGISVGAAVMELPPADRIALARELLAGTGMVVAPARWVEDQRRRVDAPPQTNRNGAWWDGWNACRAAMLGDE